MNHNLNFRYISRNIHNDLLLEIFTILNFSPHTITKYKRLKWTSVAHSMSTPRTLVEPTAMARTSMEFEGAYSEVR